MRDRHGLLGGMPSLGFFYCDIYRWGVLTSGIVSHRRAQFSLGAEFFIRFYALTVPQVRENTMNIPSSQALELCHGSRLQYRLMWHDGLWVGEDSNTNQIHPNSGSLF